MGIVSEWLESYAERVREEEGQELLKLPEEFDGAIVGVLSDSFDAKTPRVVYSTGKVVDVYVEMGMTDAEALEYFQFNTLGAWVGPYTPLFLDDPIYF